MRIKSGQILVGGAVLVLLVAIYAIAMEAYLRTSKTEGTFEGDVKKLVIASSNATITIEESDTDEIGYFLARSRNPEITRNSSTVFLDFKSGILSIRVPRGMEIEAVEIDDENGTLDIFDLAVGSLEVRCGGNISMHFSKIGDAAVSCAAIDISESIFGTLAIESSGRVDITDVDAENIILEFDDEDATILGGRIGKVNAESGSGSLDIDTANGIGYAETAGAAVTIYRNGTDFENRIYRDEENPDGTIVAMHSDTGSIKLW